MTIADNSAGMLLSAKEVHRVPAEAGWGRLHFTGGAGLRCRAGSALLDARVAFTAKRGGETSDSQRARVYGIREGALCRSVPEAEESTGAGKGRRESFYCVRRRGKLHAPRLCVLALLHERDDKT